MITFCCIENLELENLIKRFDETIQQVKNEFGIELKTYGNILRISLNTLQQDAFDNLLDRVNFNKELENALSNAGGYEIDFIKDYNPKTILSQILQHLKGASSKLSKLQESVKKIPQNVILVADSNDVEFLRPTINRSKTLLLSHGELKKYDFGDAILVFYSFNGSVDFDFVYNLTSDVHLVLFNQEYQLFQKQLQRRKKLLELEINSNERFEICSVIYENTPDKAVQISSTIEEIVNRLDSWGQRTQGGYKDEGDLLLDEIEEKITYRFKTTSGTVFLDSNDTVYDSSGDLIKAYKVKPNDKIRVYPREELAENLYQVAVGTEPDLFGKVEEHSKYWINAILELNKKYDVAVLYDKLQQRGLRVQLNTVDSYLKGSRKFPMFNNDLRAIIELHSLEKGISDRSEELLRTILKSKTTYNSTMIALGRGLKQELKLFLTHNVIGEILEKRNFTASTLQIFIDEYMPTLIVTEKVAFAEDVEQIKTLTFLQQLDL